MFLIKLYSQLKKKNQSERIVKFIYFEKVDQRNVFQMQNGHVMSLNHSQYQDYMRGVAFFKLVF